MNTRRLYEWAVPASAVALIPLLSVLYAGHVPDPMAIHWGLGGEPDGSGPLAGQTALVTAAAAALGLGPLVGLRWLSTRQAARALVAGGHLMAVFFLILHWATLAHNAGAARWQDATPFAIGSLIAIVAFSVALAAPAFVVAGDRPDDGAAGTHEPADVPVAPGEAVVWSGRAGGRTAAAIGAVALAVSAAVWLVVPGGAGAALSTVAVLVAAAVGLTLTSARVVVGPGGVRASLGPWGWPGQRVALDRITGVEVVDVEPMAFGGWGYRVVPGARALVVRRGEGLRIHREGGPDLVVTVDDARTGAGVLLAHLEQRSATGL